VKLITICLKERASSTKSRLAEMNHLLSQIDDLKINPSVAIFPGGTFDLKKLNLLDPSQNKRITEVNKTGITRNLMKMCKDRNLHLILGIDTKDSRDQCVSYIDKSGIKCIARKIFPVKGEEADSWCSNVEDAKIGNRVVKIKGYNFLLAVCYDMYGAEILRYKKSKRLHNIKKFSKNNVEVSNGEPGFNELKKEFVSNWCNSVKSSDIGIACIHEFTKSGEKSGISYWQRDGIVNQFPFMKMKTVLGATHYIEGRNFPKDSSRALLAGGKSIKKMHLGSHILLNGKAFVRVWEV